MLDIGWFLCEECGRAFVTILIPRFVLKQIGFTRSKNNHQNLGLDSAFAKEALNGQSQGLAISLNSEIIIPKTFFRKGNLSVY